MKFCIPTETKDGLNARICPHFGSAPFFTIYDAETGNIKVFDNSNEDHGDGNCSPVNAIQDLSIDGMICSAIGRNAVLRLNSLGIKVYRAERDTVSEIVKDINSLSEISAENACNHHGRH